MEHENKNWSEQDKHNIKADIGGGFLSKMKWYEKLFFYIFCGGIILTIAIMASKIKRDSQTRLDVKRKLRYFNPIISDGFWGKKIIWVGREKPLTDDELEMLL